MKRRALVIVAALALAAGACGGDDDDVTDGASATFDGASATSDDAEDSGDVGSGGGSDESDIDADDSAIRDRIVSQFEALGITEDQANCLIDNMDREDVAAVGDQVDPSMFLHLFSTCGIEFDPQAGD